MTKKKNYFNMIRIALRLGGLSVRENESTAYEVFFFPFLCFICAYPFFALGDVFKKDFETVADLLKYEFTLFVGIIKIISVRLNRVNIGKLLEKLEKTPFLENQERGGDNERRLIKQCTFIITAQTTAYWTATAFVALLGVMYTLAKRIKSNDYHDWVLPFGSFTLFNPTHSPNYEISWFYQCLSCGWIGAVFTIIDSTVAAVLIHICFQLKILQNNLRSIATNSYKRMLKEKIGSGNVLGLNETIIPNDLQLPVIEWEYLHLSLKEVVKYHLAIINAVKYMNESFSTLLLMVFLGTLGILTFMVYRASVLPLNDVRLLQGVGETIIITLQVALVCFWSEQVTFESEEVGIAAFQSNFVGTDLRFQKSLSLIIRRSRSPLTLSAGKFFDIGLATFTKILRSSYSAFMVLRNLKDG